LRKDSRVCGNPCAFVGFGVETRKPGQFKGGITADFSIGFILRSLTSYFEFPSAFSGVFIGG
jgi:hypothetical protein